VNEPAEFETQIYEERLGGPTGGVSFTEAARMAATVKPRTGRTGFGSRRLPQHIGACG
jgi:hypothetical protein